MCDARGLPSCVSQTTSGTMGLSRCLGIHSCRESCGNGAESSTSCAGGCSHDSLLHAKEKKPTKAHSIYCLACDLIYPTPFPGQSPLSS